MPNTVSSFANTAARQIMYDEIQTAFKEDDSILTWIGADEMPTGTVVNDRGIEFVSYVRPNPSGGAFSDGAALAAWGTPSLVKQSCAFTDYSITGAVTGRTIKLLNDPNNIMKGLQPLVEWTRKSLKVDLAHYVFGDGRGIKAIRSATAIVGTTVTFETTVLGGSTYGTRLILNGGRYNFINPANGGIRAGGGTSVCTATIRSGTTVEFDAIPNDTAAGDLLVRENSYNACMRGFGYSISNNALTFFGVSRGDYDELNSNVVDALTQAMTQSLARRMDYVMQVRRANKTPVAVIVGTPQLQALEEVYHPLVRVSNDDRVGKIGFEGFTIGGKDVIREQWAPDDKMTYVDKSSWMPLNLHNTEPWTGPDGNVFYPEPQVSATGTAGTGMFKDNWIFGFVVRNDLFCFSARDNGVTQNLGLPEELVRPYSVSR